MSRLLHLPDPELAPSLAKVFLALGDDEFLLGHRDSEWCGHAPILEEDIAFANLALDEIGHATLWYGLYAGLATEGEQETSDHLVFQRPWREWRNIQMVELPRGDWAFSILRQFLFDSAESVRLAAMSNSSYAPLAEIAAKMLKEETYHLRHSRAWVQRLGLGTQESQARMQNALQGLWLYAQQVLSPFKDEDPLVRAGLLPDSQSLHALWLENTTNFLAECALVVPSPQARALDRAQHTQHLQILISEMQSVANLDPQAKW